jgi:hypothetical protein
MTNFFGIGSLSTGSPQLGSRSLFFHTETQEQYLAIKTSFNIKSIFLSINRRWSLRYSQPGTTTNLPKPATMPWTQRASSKDSFLEMELDWRHQAGEKVSGSFTRWPISSIHPPLKKWEIVKSTEWMHKMEKGIPDELEFCVHDIVAGLERFVAVPGWLYLRDHRRLIDRNMFLML